MSWTKRQFIKAAFEEIGLAAYVYDLQPGQLENAMRRLDTMIASWNAKGIRLGYPMPSSPEDSNLDTESGVPDAANQAIILNLGIQLAPAFGKTVSPDTKMGARDAYRGLQARFTKPIERQLPREMPLGAGNKRWRWSDHDEFVVPPVDPLEVGDDDVLEYE